VSITITLLWSVNQKSDESLWIISSYNGCVSVVGGLFFAWFY